MSNSIEYVGKDQNWTDEQTIYWFGTEEGKFGVVEGRGAGIVDDECAPITGMWFEREVTAALENAVTDEMRSA